jgi:hypothetical protein
MSKRSAFSTAVVLALLAAGCGGSSNPRADASRFVVDYIDHARGHCCARGLHATITKVTLSRPDARWVVVDVSITSAKGWSDGESFGVAVHRVGSKWRLVDYGTGRVGCNMPPDVQEDLHARDPIVCTPIYGPYPGPL